MELLAWIGIPAALVVAAVARLRWLYPDPGRELVQLRPWSHAFVRTAGETLFPPGGALGVSSDDADVVGYLDRWLDALPGQQRALIKALFLMLEHAPLLQGRLARFSSLPLDRRGEVLGAWEGSRLYLRRTMITALRTVFSFAYLDHPRVREALGMSERDACQPVPTTHLTPEDRGAGRLLDRTDHPDDVTEECDVVVVGTGAGGAVAAQVLAEAGLDVVILEEGPFLRPEEIARDCGTGMLQVMHEAGMRTMLGPTVTPTIQGRCVGGSTFPNSAILFRIPDFVLDGWAEEHGVVGLTNDALAASYERVERAAHVHPARPEQLGPKNLLFAKGAEAVGIDAHPFQLAKDGCRGCGECYPSCPIGAKYSTDRSHVPDAVRAGARLYVNARCDEVLAAEGGARGVLGSFLDERGRGRGRLRVRSRAVVLGGGVFGTPLILRRSGLANSSGQVGRNLHTHPGAAMFGVFDEPVNPWVGSTQGYGAFVDETLKIEVLWSPLAVMAVRMPGFGHVLSEHLGRFRHIAVWDVVVRSTSTGRILFASGSNPTVWYRINQRDTDIAVRGMGILAEMFFAAGARTVMPGIHGLPHVMGPEDTGALVPGTIRPSQITFAATHLFGTCRMGSDPATSVVDSRGECHDVRNLFICDASVMPDGTQVNPHEPIMALSDYFAHGIVERLRHGA